MEAVALGADHTACVCHVCSSLMILSPGILQIGGPIVKSLSSICQLAATSRQKVCIRRVGTSATRYKCILVDLLISRLCCALIVVLVRRAANSAHGDTSHA